MTNKQPLRRKDIKRYDDINEADFKIGSDRYRYRKRLTFAGIAGGIIGFILQSNAPEEWGIDSPMYFFLFILMGIIIGDFLRRIAGSRK